MKERGPKKVFKKKLEIDSTQRVVSRIHASMEALLTEEQVFRVMRTQSHEDFLDLLTIRFGKQLLELILANDQTGSLDLVTGTNLYVDFKAKND